MSPGHWPEEPGLQFLIHFLWRKKELCAGEQECNRLRPCVCNACGHAWETRSESPDACERCGDWKSVEIARCYDCPLTAFEEEMMSSRGQLISRVSRIHNLMLAKVTYTAADLTVEESRVLEMIQAEKPQFSLMPDGQ